MEKVWRNGKFLNSAEAFYIKTNFTLVIDSSHFTQSKGSAGF